MCVSYVNVCITGMQTCRNPKAPFFVETEEGVIAYVDSYFAACVTLIKKKNLPN